MLLTLEIPEYSPPKKFSINIENASSDEIIDSFNDLIGKLCRLGYLSEEDRERFIAQHSNINTNIVYSGRSDSQNDSNGGAYPMSFMPAEQLQHKIGSTDSNDRHELSDHELFQQYECDLSEHNAVYYKVMFRGGKANIKYDHTEYIILKGSFIRLYPNERDESGEQSYSASSTPSEIAYKRAHAIKDNKIKIIDSFRGLVTEDIHFYLVTKSAAASFVLGCNVNGNSRMIELKHE